MRQFAIENCTELYLVYYSNTYSTQHLFSLLLGTPTITSIQFELTSATDAATLSFTLDCITVGGPVNFNDITWTRAGSSLPTNHGLFQVLDDGSTATYSNTLAVTGRETGVYTCSLQPPGGNLIKTINVEGTQEDYEIKLKMSHSCIIMLGFYCAYEH